MLASQSEVVQHTEAGAIPLDWNVQPLGELADFLDGRRRPVKDADRARMHGGIPYYGASGIIDYVNGYLFDEDLILLGEDSENILSRNLPLAFKITGKSWVNNHAHVLRAKPGTDIDYLTAYLESLDYERFNSGTAQPKLNKKNCELIPIALPPTPKEQRNIAEALSDADALIESLESLIAKKRAIKQGAMQELLTGRKRLADFTKVHDFKDTEIGRIPADWRCVPLGELFEITSSKRVFQNQWRSQGIPFYRAREIAVLSETGSIDNELFIDEELYATFRRNHGVPVPGDLFVTGVGTLGKVYVFPDNQESFFSISVNGTVRE